MTQSKAETVMTLQTVMIASRRLSAFEVSEIVVEKGIKSVTELQALASKK